MKASQLKYQKLIFCFCKEQCAWANQGRVSRNACETWRSVSSDIERDGLEEKSTKSTSEMILQAAVWLQEMLFQFFCITSVKYVRRYHSVRKCRYTITHTVLVNKSAWWMQVDPNSSSEIPNVQRAIGNSIALCLPDNYSVNKCKNSLFLQPHFARKGAIFLTIFLCKTSKSISEKGSWNRCQRIFV